MRRPPIPIVDPKQSSGHSSVPPEYVRSLSTAKLTVTYFVRPKISEKNFTVASRAMAATAGLGVTRTSPPRPNFAAESQKTCSGSGSSNAWVAPGYIFKLTTRRDVADSESTSFSHVSGSS